MAPTPKYDYDLIVIGCGSGGMGVSRRAAKYGKKVAVIEASPRLGGTCVNVGCVPKKIMWHAADMSEKIREAKHYGFNVDEKTVGTIDWPLLKKKRDAYIKRLNGIYERNLEKDSVEYHWGRAKFVGPHELEIVPEAEGTLVSSHDTPAPQEKKRLTAERICIAVGGHPTKPDVEGKELAIDSDGFFLLEDLPKRVVLVGAGYIAVEFAGIFQALGSETHLLIRRDTFLRSFDPIIAETVQKHMAETGLHVHKKTNVQKITTDAQGPHDLSKPFPKTVHTDSKDHPTIEADTVIFAIGRSADTKSLNLECLPAPGVELDKKGYVVVDEYSESATKHISAIGDDIGKLELTPVAIAAGRRLANRLYGPEKFKDQKMDYNNVPSVVFSHPPSGSVGLSEQAAKEKYGEDKIKVYKSNFTAMYFGMMPQEEKQPSAYKMITLLPEEKVLGIHIVGLGADEIMQGFGVAVHMGATKDDLDNTIAIHPTSGEELVTMT